MQRKDTRRLDSIIKEYFRSKYSACEKCGDTKRQMHVHHFFGRKNLSVRWDLDNLFHICSYCHKLSPDSAHENPSEFEDWAIEKRGQEWYDRLLIKKRAKVLGVPMDFDDVMLKLSFQLHEREEV